MLLSCMRYQHTTSCTARASYRRAMATLKIVVGTHRNPFRNTAGFYDCRAAKHGGTHRDKAGTAEQFTENVAFWQWCELVCLIIVALPAIRPEEHGPPIDY